MPISIRTVTKEALFAGKMHAALFRVWKRRVKGRDWYDIVWFTRKGIPLDLTLFSKIHGLNKRMKEEEFWKLLNERIAMLDVEGERQDILPFVKDQEVIERSWSKDYFSKMLAQIQFV